MDPDNEIVVELPNYVRVYKSGRVERLRGTDVVPAGLDPATGVSSKDVVIDPATGVSARLYLPSLAVGPPGEEEEEKQEKRKLPVLLYIHGGAFIIETAFSPLYHTYLNALVSHANVLAVSLNYRRAPENPVPAAYEDTWAALEWAASHAPGGPEPWLADHGDLGRVFLAGDSAGGNIVHNVAKRAGSAGLQPGVHIERLALVHPFFWGSKPIGLEPIDPAARAGAERLWAFVCPSTAGIDDPRINPTANAAPALAGLAGERALVCVAGRDLLCQRGRAYYGALKTSGWGGVAELLESPDEGHGFHLFHPGCENALAMTDRLVHFFTQD